MSTPPSWREPRHPDHYYWLTARLAARGARFVTGRVIASVIIGLGLLPVTFMFSVVGSPELPRRLLAAGIAVCCALVGSVWLRERWPTRTQSELCVVIASACITVASLIAPRPIIGLLGATSFAVLASFTAVFHGRQLLGWVWTIAAAVLGVLAVRLTALDTTVAVSCVSLVAVSILFTTFVSRALLGLIDTDTVTGRIEPITGLLSREGFDDGVAMLIAARDRQDDRYLVIGIISLDSFSIALALSDMTSGNQARIAIAQCLRDTARHDAVLAHVCETDFLVADVFTSPDPRPLTDRIAAAVRTTSPELSASIGCATTPLAPLTAASPHDVTAELLAHATTAMYEARHRGGNQARTIHLPDLTTPGAPSID
jgi:GGDEF domain-containing protein